MSRKIGYKELCHFRERQRLAALTERPNDGADRRLDSLPMPNDEYKGEARDERLQGPMTVQKKELEHVRKKMTADARDKCHETRAAYVECAKGAISAILLFLYPVLTAHLALLSQAARSASHSSAERSSRSSMHAFHNSACAFFRAMSAGPLPRSALIPARLALPVVSQHERRRARAAARAVPRYKASASHGGAQQCAAERCDGDAQGEGELGSRA